jgi:hypothetical protein
MEISRMEKPENEKQKDANAEVINALEAFMPKTDWGKQQMQEWIKYSGQSDYKGAWESLLLVVKYSPKLQGIQEVINDIEELYKIKK